MAKKGPRVPLPATIKLPGIERDIQVNHCKMPDCRNFACRPEPSMRSRACGVRIPIQAATGSGNKPRQ